ncbi:drug resistance transporter, EmrB/QacA subfamily [Chitinophaga jiangningensis]|uniref:Drug resistance transporter, EmrB/QacA subfamily n=1 Tax=Chitinophaga jiangningensis TaxID=1419482 RepID=A0A1M7L6C7_9BACT|nr:MFS transporter [Chitinophaga jiangningensis]SHM73357.1 drug resistance transporter, EmrB/QacA subfamily [Chitinophaga jiangningensis]
MISIVQSENNRWWQLWIVSAAAFLSVIDIFIVNVALPSIQAGLHSTEADLQLVIAAYLIGYAAFLITGGRLGDYLGKKRVFVAGMISFTVMSCCCGLAQTAGQLNSFRFLQGVCAAFMVPQSIAYIHLLFPEHEERIKALGIYGSIAGTASVIGQLLGGLIPDVHFLMDGWRWIFLINLPIGILATWFAVKFLHETPLVSQSRFDVSGVLLLTATLIFLIYPLIRGRELGWPLWAVCMLLAALVMLVLFIRDQRHKGLRNQEPLIDLRLFGFRDFNIGLLAVLFYFMVQDSYFLINAVLLQNGLGFSSSLTGLLFAAQGIGYVVAAVSSIRLVKLYGRKVLMAGVLLMAVTLFLHIKFFQGDVIASSKIYLLLFVYGMGCGSVLPSLLTLSIRSIPPAFAGAASGTYTTFQQTAVALGIGVSGGVFFRLLEGEHSVTAYIHAYHWATWLNIVFLVVTAVLLYFLPKK